MSQSVRMVDPNYCEVTIPYDVAETEQFSQNCLEMQFKSSSCEGIDEFLVEYVPHPASIEAFMSNLDDDGTFEMLNCEV